MVSIGIIGGAGRMGRAITACLEEDPARFALAGAIGRGGDVAALAGKAEVLIDFSTPDALAGNLEAAMAAGKPILIGTTGLAPAHHAAIDAATQHIAVLQTGNTSLGVTLLAALVAEAAAKLGPGWDIAIHDIHHRHKVDAPSGTALLLGEAAAEGRGAHGGTAITYSSARGGSVVGEHQVLFLGPGERLTLAHSAEDRAIFARGALRAAGWLVSQTPGRYTMRAVLGL